MYKTIYRAADDCELLFIRWPGKGTGQGGGERGARRDLKTMSRPRQMEPGCRRASRRRRIRIHDSRWRHRALPLPEKLDPFCICQGCVVRNGHEKNASA